MPDSETEEQTLERIETALRKISAAAHAPKPVAGAGLDGGGGGIDRAALAQSLDLLISRLRSGLEPPRPTHDITE